MAITAEGKALGSPAGAERDWFGRYAWGVTAYNVLVVLWGAFVRATGSGAGCGEHWPLCNGVVVPRAPRLETVIEFTHRITSGLALAAVAGLCIWALYLYPRGHRVRRLASLSMVFLVIEALLGAGLVLFRYVEHDASAGRAAYLSAHLANTEVLLAVLAMTAWCASRGAQGPSWRKGDRTLLGALPAAIAISITGVIAALGDTLWPAQSVASGVLQEFSAASAGLLRLRLLHPGVAILCGAYLFWAAGRVLRKKPHPALKRLALLVLTVLALQLIAGAVNIVLLAPVWMQIVHLLVANVLWLALVLLWMESLEPQSHAASVYNESVSKL